MTTKTKQVLLVDDEKKLLDALSQRLKLMGFEVRTALDGMTAVDIARNHLLDLAVVDLQMPGMDGLVTITKLKEIKPDLKTILLTGHGNQKIKQTTESLNSRYFEKDEMETFWDFIKKITADGKVVVIRPGAEARASGRPSGFPAAAYSGNEIEIRSESSFPTPPAFEGPGASGLRALVPDRPRIVGETAAMQKLRKSVQQVGALDCPVILRGETGTGKELAARAIHAASRRVNYRFMAINCGCFGDEQLVGQLFGHNNDNLVQAIQAQSNGLDESRVGTLLLDHIEDMPLRLQIQLLKIIDATERPYTDQMPDGAIAFRILAATDSDLAQRVGAGAFRKDLFYRLNLFELNVPPLRERKDDIPPLSYYFLNKYREEFNKRVEKIDEQVLDIFAAYDFPGNVRELEHIIERAIILADGNTIAIRHLPGRFRQEALGTAATETRHFTTLAAMENKYIVEVLKAANGNKSKTSEILGISRAALWRKLKQINADREP